MILRRIAAFAIAIAMLHLNAVRADAACATHQGGTSALEGNAGASAHHAGSGGGESHSSGGEHCPAPTQTDCCQAVTSCSIVVSIGDGTVVTSLTQHDAGVAIGMFARPISRVAAPEPPPPKR